MTRDRHYRQQERSDHPNAGCHPQAHGTRPRSFVAG
jgi:hypothetical protein